MINDIKMLGKLIIRISNYIMLPKFIPIRATILLPICIILLIIAWKVDKINLLKEKLKENLKNEKTNRLDLINIEENKVIS